MKSWTRKNTELLERLADRAVLRAHLSRAIQVGRLRRKYSPDQPRVPAGSSDGGQWTSEDGGGETTSSADSTIQIAGQSVLFCNNQLLIDNWKCDSVQPNWYRAACRNQAMERYAACLVGRPLPPLPFFGD
jgi:hypothetical protein